MNGEAHLVGQLAQLRQSPGDHLPDWPRGLNFHGLLQVALIALKVFKPSVRYWQPCRFMSSVYNQTYPATACAGTEDHEHLFRFCRNVRPAGEMVTVGSIFGRMGFSFASALPVPAGWLAIPPSPWPVLRETSANKKRVHGTNRNSFYSALPAQNKRGFRF